MKGQTTIHLRPEDSGWSIIVKPINGWVKIKRSDSYEDNFSPSEAKKLVAAIQKAIAVIEKEK